MTDKKCAARGSGWMCDKDRVYRRYCVAHQRQMRLKKDLQPVKSWTRVSERRRDDTYLCLTCKQYKGLEKFGMCSTGPRPDCNPCCSAKRRARRYGLSPSEVSHMLARQGGRCLICGISQDDAPQVFAVDHDHSCCNDAVRTCGKCVRGILCRTCNAGLGLFRDSPELLLKAIEYLNSTSVVHATDNPSKEARRGRFTRQAHR